MRQLLRSQLVSTGATDVLLLALTTVSGILIARLLGPEGRGEYTIAILWPSIIAAIGNLGLREAFTYEQARSPKSRSTLTGHALILAAGLSIPLMALGLILVPVLTKSQAPQVTQAGLVFLWVIPANLLAQYALGVLHGNLDIGLFNTIRLSVNLFYLIAVLVLWTTSALTIWNLTLALLAANVVTATMAVVIVLAKFGSQWHIDLELTRSLFSYGIRNHFGSMTFLLNQRADQMLMALMITPVQLGWYTAAANISSMARLASGAFGTMAFPKVTNKPFEEQRTLTALYSRLNFTATLALGLSLMVCIPWLIPLLYGHEYSPSIIPAEILTFAAIFVGIGQAWAGSLRGLNQPMVPTKAEMVALIITVLGLALTLRPFGILGASVTSLVAYIVSSIIMFAALRRLFSFNLRDLLWLVSLAAIRSKVALKRG